MKIVQMQRDDSQRYTDTGNKLKITISELLNVKSKITLCNKKKTTERVDCRR